MSFGSRSVARLNASNISSPCGPIGDIESDGIRSIAVRIAFGATANANNEERNERRFTMPTFSVILVDGQ